jgi:uroporphyrinogen decarboxylase
MMSSRPEEFVKLMDLLTDNTVRYLDYQKAAGIDVFQIFDTWAGILSGTEYEKFVLPCVQKIFARVDLPSIYFIKNNKALLEAQVKSGADFLSVCHTIDLKNNELLLKSGLGVQGNLNVERLYGDYAQLEKDVNEILSAASKYKRFIFNLSHGLLPDIDPEKVKFVVKKVHEYSWTKSV